MQALIAYSIVAVASAYAAWLLMPQRQRRWIVARLGALMPASQRGWIARLEKASGETGCSTCKGCAADGNPPAASIKAVELRRH